AGPLPGRTLATTLRRIPFPARCNRWNAMLRAILRTISLVCLAIALVAGVLDVARSIADSSVVMRPLFDDWYVISQGSLAWLKLTTEKSLHPVVWDPVLMTLLKSPTWAVFAVLSLLFGLLTRRRRRRWQENFTA
ncbi:MAG: hypothetical protein VYD64_08575, partial [Pseudomonadota bacterium]|nr:hypothetical protein [Pseudomonadota bacterium]